MSKGQTRPEATREKRQKEKKRKWVHHCQMFDDNVAMVETIGLSEVQKPWLATVSEVVKRAAKQVSDWTG